MEEVKNDVVEDVVEEKCEECEGDECECKVDKEEVEA